MFAGLYGWYCDWCGSDGSRRRTILYGRLRSYCGRNGSSWRSGSPQAEAMLLLVGGGRPRRHLMASIHGPVAWSTPRRFIPSEDPIEMDLDGSSSSLQSEVPWPGTGGVRGPARLPKISAVPASRAAGTTPRSNASYVPVPLGASTELESSGHGSLARLVSELSDNRRSHTDRLVVTFPRLHGGQAHTPVTQRRHGL